MCNSVADVTIKKQRASQPAADNCMKNLLSIPNALAALVIVGLVLAAFESCNVVRTITTTAQTVQKGDTTVVIMTKTVEQYDGNIDATRLAPFVH